MSDKKQYSDEELVCFLDGEASGELATNIALAIETDADLRARIKSLELDKEMIRASFEGILQAAPPPSLEGPSDITDMPTSGETVTPAKSPYRFMRSLSQIAALLIVGFLGYNLSLLINTPAPPKKLGWIDKVASYQQLYGEKSLAHIKQDPDQARIELERISKELGRNINFDVITSQKEIELKRSQLLEFNGKPLAQISYQTSAGAVLALCIIKAKKPGEAEPKYSTKGNMQMALWRRGGYAYLLIGGQDPNLIKTISSDFSKKL